MSSNHLSDKDAADEKEVLYLVQEFLRGRSDVELLRASSQFVLAHCAEFLCKDKSLVNQGPSPRKQTDVRS